MCVFKLHPTQSVEHRGKHFTLKQNYKNKYCFHSSYNIFSTLRSTYISTSKK